MASELTWKDNVRQKLQWWRVPIMVAFVAVGIYLIRSQSVWLWIGMAITFIGELIQLWAASQLRKDKVLATSGPYAHVRNPMYFGRFFVLFGFIIMIQQAWWKETAFMGIPLIVLGYIVVFNLYVIARVGREEARLRSIFGPDYDDYCKEVRRFLPRIRPYSKTAGKKLSWSQLVANHEYLNMIAVIIVYALILLRLKLLNP